MRFYLYVYEIHKFALIKQHVTTSFVIKFGYSKAFLAHKDSQIFSTKPMEEPRNYLPVRALEVTTSKLKGLRDI